MTPQSMSPANSLVILGIDPSSTNTGFGLVDYSPQRCTLVELGCIRTPTKASLDDRLVVLFDRIAEVIAEFEPQQVAMESSFYGKDPDAAGKLGQARGVLSLAVRKSGRDVFQYTPTEVKKAVVGRGAATKEQVQFMVGKLLNLAEVPRPLDASDALAVALCHVHRQRVPSAKAPSRRKPEIEALLSRVSMR